MAKTVQEVEVEFDDAPMLLLSQHIGEMKRTTKGVERVYQLSQSGLTFIVTGPDETRMRFAVRSLLEEAVRLMEGLNNET